MRSEVLSEEIESGGKLRATKPRESRRQPRLRRFLVSCTLLTPVAFAVMTATLPAAAQDATWLTNPGSGNFNAAVNWTPTGVPVGTAFFGTSSTTSL